MSPPALPLDADQPANTPGRSWTHRILWTLVGAMILNWSVTLYGPASIYAPVTVLDVLAGFWGLSLIIGSWLDFAAFPQLQRADNLFGWFNALVLVALVGAWAYLQFHNNPGYSTDELSFDQYAGQLVAHGLHNPYVNTMAPAGPMFRLSPDGYTYTITGTPVLKMSYPSLSFLIYVPFLLLGWTNELGAGLNVAGWMVAILLMFWLLPRNLRPAVLLLSSIDVYLSFAVGGVTDMLYIPLLVIAAYKWDRFGESRLSYINPIAVGLAMSIKQTPWPVVAFVLCALAWDEYDKHGNIELAAKRAGRYFAIVVGVFLIPNLPYLIASPSAWFDGVFQPFTAQMVPAGQGLISLTLFAHLGGGSLVAYTFLLLLMALLTLVVFVGTYPLLRPATFILPSVFYFFAARSQTNYLIPLVPVGIVGAITAGPPAARRAAGVGKRLGGIMRSRLWLRATGAVAVAAALAIVYAFTSLSPLTVTILKEGTTGYLGGIRFLDIEVHNHTDHPLKPSYTIQTSHGDTTFWRVNHGPRMIKPGTTAKIQIYARNYQAEPGLSDGFAVLAFTDHPEAVSVSHRFLINLWRTATSPQSFNDPQAIGKVVTVRAQVLDHFNSPVRRAGVEVIMNQTIYAGFGVRKATASIDGEKPGHRAHAFTNSRGVATFHVVGTRPGIFTFSVHLLKRGQYIFGTSGYLDITFQRKPVRA
jgi:uncharacterized membrane protein